MRFSKSLLASALLVTMAVGCEDVPNDEEVWPPKGVMKGTVTYLGPLPCSENGHVVGDAVITIWNVNLLPPPAGLGLSSHRVAVVPGDVLFAGVAHKIPTDPNGLRACPPAGTPPVQVSASWEVGPVDPGLYETRAWFDYDGDWHAAFKFANMISKGDIGGGSVDNITEALAGQPARYTKFEIGIRGADGQYRIPENGFVRDNVTILLALPIPTNRPYFHISSMRRGGDENGAPEPIPFPSDQDVVMPADYRLYNSDTGPVSNSLYYLDFAAGLPDPEVEPAKARPFFFRLDQPQTAPSLFVQRYDANKNGVIDPLDRVTGSENPLGTLVSLGPIISLTKLDVENDRQKLWRTTQNKPRVLSSLVVTPGDMATILGLIENTSFDSPVPVSAIRGWVRPSAVCIEDASNANSRTLIVTPHQKDRLDEHPVIGNEPATIQDIAAQLSRDPASTEIVYACLPPGTFAINVIYPSTGQAWTLPNESGICMPGEAPGNGTCGDRVKLESQFRTLKIGPAADPNYCNGLRDTPAGQTFRQYCLTPSEQKRFDDGTLWN